MPRVRLTNNSLNSYGFRILTAGIDTSQYQRNAVLLYMHNRGQVIGLVKDIQVNNDEITGELSFDEATDLSKQAKKQFEFGSLRMVSIGIDVLETSSDPSVILKGQTRPTVTKSKLFEVSLVDIGANDDAIVMRFDGKQINLSKDDNNALPSLFHKITNNPTPMEEKELLAQKEAEIKTLKEQLAQMRLAQVTAAVDQAIAEHRLSPDKKQDFVKVGESMGLEALQSLLAAFPQQQKISQYLNPGTGKTSPAPTQYQKLGDVPADERIALRQNDPDTYRRLYKAEYGVDCVLN